jgi:ABC-2 type transport system permease protein
MSRDRSGTATTIGVIARSELVRTARDRTAMFFVVLLPVVIIVVIGSTFGGDESVAVGVVDRDGTGSSRRLVTALDEARGVEVETYRSRDTLRRDIRTGAVDAGVVVPTGYGAALDAGDDARVELIADPTSGTSAAVQLSVRAAVGDEAVAIAAGRAAAEAGGTDVAAAIEQAMALGGSTPTVRVTSEQVDEGRATLGSFDYTAPANLVLFTFVNTLVIGSLLAMERKQGITRRMLATPHGTGTILAGIGASKFLFALLQSALIVVVGAVLFGVSWGDPLAAALLVVLFAAVATSVGLLVGSTVGEPDQAIAIATPVAIAMGMLGGCMWPLEIVPPVMRTVGHAVPQAWAMDAWIALVFDGAGLGDVAGDLAVLAGFAVVLGLLARRQLRRALTR